MTAEKEKVRAEAMQYIRSFPSRDSTGSNIRVHARFKDCIERPEKISNDQWKVIWEMLHYRQQLMHASQSLVHDPFDCTPADQRDGDQWFIKECDTTEKREHLLKVLVLIGKASLFPQPADVKTQGKFWTKPSRYLAAAMISSGLDLKGMEQVVQSAEKRVQKEPGELCGVNQVYKEDKVRH